MASPLVPRLCVALAFLGFLSIYAPSVLVSADADFVDVRLTNEHDRSSKRGDPKDKYFHESIFDPHYDGRFASAKVSDAEKLGHLQALMQTFLATMADIGAETWIMHGTLLGWWWNQRIMPWDSDVDVQVSETTLAFLAKYYNMTEYSYTVPGLLDENGDKKAKAYLMEVNSHFVYRDVADWLNVIDARWIDTETGLFIDISTVRPDYDSRAQGVQGALMVKDRHKYLERDIFPLRDSFFEGIQVRVPFEYAALLEEEYGKKSLTQTTFNGYRFNDTSKMWEKTYQPGQVGLPLSTYDANLVDVMNQPST